MKVHERISSYIKACGLKQYVIAKKAGYEHKRFSAMMTGRKRITGEDIELICRALNVSANEFIKPEEIETKVG
ncbi:XRE family transcriptional regulator [Desulfosporosinus fructosivorans]|uniref:XRE family transcriptional regulator n=1 Tax=Desulfosporosinus fructosivorans TaxID=2018669 RepID=A0A4Z0R141_9FIRM|nr:helix-turn-helix transcriptional regulator [Desulfosporosinus fructosivorans]TGE35923.1 XRE family transcriptional regulator [Desulfosporosinus fructosivorans]